MAFHRFKGFFGTPRFVSLLIASLPLILLISISIGSYGGVGLKELVSCIVGECDTISAAILERRAVRSVSALVSGAALAAAGATLQHTLRNPLADPYIVGVAGGAGLGAIASVAIGLYSPMAVYALALTGGIVAYTIVSLVSLVTGMRTLSFILAGVAVGYIAWSISIILLVKYAVLVKGGILWLFGSVAYVTKKQLVISSALTLAPLAWLLARRRGLSLILLGDEVAASMGFNVNTLRYEAFIASSALTAAAVALAGPIGFVGLIAPWLARSAYGSVYSRLLLASTVLGAWVLLVSDIVSRSVFSPTEIPLTAITSLAGVPVMIYIMSKLRGEAR